MNEIREPNLEKVESKLHFVKLPPYFRLQGRNNIPQSVIDWDYNPNTDRQIAVFGNIIDLKTWCKLRNMTEELYPIHPSALGTHIDIYGGSDIAAYVPSEKIIDIKDFGRKQKN